MIIEMLAQSETSSEEKAPQWGLVGLHSISTLKEFLYGKENVLVLQQEEKQTAWKQLFRFFFLLFEEKEGCGRLVFYFKKIKEKGYYLVFTRGSISCTPVEFST